MHVSSLLVPLFWISTVDGITSLGTSASIVIVALLKPLLAYGVSGTWSIVCPCVYYACGSRVSYDGSMFDGVLKEEIAL